MITIKINNEEFKSILIFNKEWEVFKEKRKKKKFERKQGPGFITCNEREAALENLLDIVIKGQEKAIEENEDARNI